jgi:hypothetical protein
MKIKILFLFISLLITQSFFSQTNKKKVKTTTKKTILKKTELKTEIIQETSVVQIEEIAPETNPLKIKYKRSSLYTIMIESPGLPYADSIKKYFVTSKIPDKFNDHNLNKRNLDFFSPNEKSDLLETQKKDLKSLSKELISKNITNIDDIKSFVVNNPKYANLKNIEKTPHDIELSNVAKELVSKWFNRSKKGGFNMNLIKSRGNYDASVLDIATARASKRGLSILEDAGEELIKNTFVLVNEFKYTNKEEVAKKTSSFLNSLSNIASYAGVPAAGNINTVTTLASAGVTIAGKGYIVRTKAHLYRLNWDEETATKFYTNYWVTDKEITPEIKKAYETSDIFKLIYVGTDDSWADVQSSIFSNKTDIKLVERATMKAIDAVIVKLQKNHDEFKTKTPLFTGDPITAKIGLKEGLSNKSKFDVLEQQINEDGVSKYVNVGLIKVDDSFPIWDNRYGAGEENVATDINETRFKKVSGKTFYPGMLIVQRKGK